MTDHLPATIASICADCGNDRSRLLDIVRKAQERLGYISSTAMNLIAKNCDAPRVEVESVVTFYAFLSDRPKGHVTIRMCDDIIDEMAGSKEVAAALAKELGIGFGETTADGRISLEWTPCIGMCDQAPAALINDIPFTELSTDDARRIGRELKAHGDPRRLVRRLGNGANANELVQSMVENNIRRAGPIVLSMLRRGDGLRKAIRMSPAEVIRAIKTARLRGRGGAGFPTGMKWEFTRAADGERRFVICNADEGEPGTFKDRVILTELPDRVFAGMTIAGYAIGAKEGILYLRGEYAYLTKYLEDVLEKRRQDNLLGKNICGKEGFDFEIRIQMGAGAYVCGEETSLISSCEGHRGDPRNRPPFPAQKGYLDCPTVVNNVETLCCVTRIIQDGPGMFAAHGTSGSSGTKLLSISGDCLRPGIYELDFGITIQEILDMAGASDTAAVQVGGASGQMIGPDQFGRTICFDDLATGGSIMIFNKDRDLLAIAEKLMDFFVEESCGYCTPCRVGNVLLRQRLQVLREGRCNADDLTYLQELGETVKATSRCGLGQTSPNPILSTLKNFRPLYEAKLKTSNDGWQPTFDIATALQEGQAAAGRASAIYSKDASKA